MANSANVVWQGNGPTETGQIVAQAALAGAAAQTLFGLATVATGDAATATCTVNFIDGTKTLPFTPSAVKIQRVGGTGTNTITVLAVESITNKEAVLRASTNLNAASFIFSVEIQK